jgi:hypothetical protein
MRQVHVNTFLDTNGDGTGTIDATGDYSGAADDFFYTVPSEAYIQIIGLSVLIRDGAKFELGGYGASALALSNGIEVIIYDAAQDEEVVIAGGLPITTNTDWLGICASAEIVAVTGGGGGGNETAWAVKLHCGTEKHPLILEPGDKMIIRVSDSFIHLDDHKFFIQGVKL